jgi:hypothetical protein
MTSRTIVFFCFLFVMFSFVPLANAETLDICKTISSGGYYEMIGKINSTGTCLLIQADNVEIDCKGQIIEYGTDGANNRLGIDATHGTNSRTNLTVRNCIIVKSVAAGTNGYGVRLTRFSNSFLINNTIQTNGTSGGYGILLTTNSKSNVVENNTVFAKGSTTGNYGIYLLSGSDENTLHGNNISTTGTTGNYGLALSDSASNTIVSNIIAPGGAASGYGIYLTSTSDNNLISNNDITPTMNATSNSDAHGIYSTSSTSNNITSNRIVSTGSSRNYAVYLVTNANAHLVQDNNISSIGTAGSNYGIYISASTFNKIQMNNISTTGTTTNPGITISTGSENIVYDNQVYVQGSGNTNYGIYLTQTQNNNVSKNVVSARGAVGNYGVYFLTNADNNILEENNIEVYGTTTNYGLFISTGSSNTITRNYISANGSTRSGNTNNWGIHLTTNSRANRISNNIVNTDGGASNYGIYLLTDSNNNDLSGNTISARGDAASNVGAYISASSSNNLENNTISASGTATDYGLYIYSSSNYNTLINNSISTSGSTSSHAFQFLLYTTGYPHNNNLSRNTFGSVAGNELNIASASIDGTYLINQNINTYAFTGIGSLLNIKNESYGEIKFTNRLTGTGSGFSSKISLIENLASVNSDAVAAFNKSAEITFYNLPTTFQRIGIFRNGVLCPGSICVNATSLQAGNVTFTVTGWTNYSIQPTDTIPPTISLAYPEDDFKTSSQNITFNFTVIDDISSVMNCSVYINSVLSGQEDVANGTIGSVEVLNISEGGKEWHISCIDEGGNTNSSGNRTFQIDIQSPLITDISYSPNSTAEIDPGETLFFNVSVTDVGSEIDSVILQYHNGSEWANISMNLFAEKYSANLTLSTSPTNYTFNIWAKDTFGNFNSSVNQTFNSNWDCTWTVTPDMGQAAGFDETKHVGNVSIENTGDVEYADSNCTLDFRVSYNLDEGRIYYEGENYKNLPLPSGSISAGENRTVDISAKFLGEIIEEEAVIFFSEFRGHSSTAQQNSTMALITTTGGPYLYQKITSSPATLYLTTANFSLRGYVRNLVGDDAPANTAYNVSFNWTLPAGFTLSEGVTSIEYENVSTNVLNYNNINISLRGSGLQGLSPGTASVYLYSKGYDLNGNQIVHSEDRIILIEQVNITLSCYSLPDGVYVSACGENDGDYAEPTVQSASSGGGGGGGAGIKRTEKIESSSNLQIIRGKQNEIKVTFKNTAEKEAIKEITFEAKSSTIGKYLEISPKELSSLGPGEDAAVSLFVTSPTYIELGRHQVEISMRGTKGSENYLENKKLFLEIHELSGEEAGSLLERSIELMKKFTEAGLSFSELDVLLNSSEEAMQKFNYETVRDNYKIIEKQTTSALGAKGIIDEVSSLIEISEEKGIEVLGTKRILQLALLSLERKDFEKAYARAKEAQVTYALETKGEFGDISWYLKNYPKEISGTAVFLALFSIATYKVGKLQKLKSDIKRLKEEENIIHELMKVVQNETFNEKRMSMEEYQESMDQYGKKLSQTIERLIKLETERAYILRFTRKQKRLGLERERIIGLVKELQKDYLQDAKIETHAYELKLESYNRRLSEIDQDLATLEAKSAMRGKGNVLSILKNKNGAQNQWQ